MQYNQQWNQGPQLFPEGQPPVNFYVGYDQDIEGYSNYLVAAICNDAISNQTQSPMRSKLMAMLSANNWNNQHMQEMVTFAVKLASLYHRTEGKRIQQAIMESVRNTGLMFVGAVYSGNPQEFSNLDYNALRMAQELAGRYNALASQFANQGQPMQQQQGWNANNQQYNQAGSQHASKWANVGVSNNQQVTSQPPQQVPVQNNNNQGGSWTGNRHQHNVPAQQEEIVQQPVQQVAQEVPNNGWVLVAEDNEKVVFRPSAVQRYEMAYNPRTHKRIVMRDKDGNHKEEFIEVDMNKHALQSGLTHAQIEQRRRELSLKRDEEVSSEDAIKYIDRIIPTPTEFDEVVEVKFIDYGLGMDGLEWWVKYRLFEMKKENPEVPDLVHFNWNLVTPSLIKRTDGEAFLNNLLEAKTLDSVRDVMLTHSVSTNAELWNMVNDLLTNEVNVLVMHRLGIKALSIDDFTSDIGDLQEIISEEYGEVYYNKLNSRRNFFIPTLLEVVDEEEERKTIYDAVLAYDDMKFEDFNDELSLFKQRIGLTVVEYNAYDFEFEIGLGESKMITHEVSNKVRSLADAILGKWGKNTHAEYLKTKDGHMYRILRGGLDETSCLLLRTK